MKKASFQKLKSTLESKILRSRLKKNTSDSTTKKKLISDFGHVLTIEPYGWHMLVITNPKDFEDIHYRMTLTHADGLAQADGYFLTLQSDSDGVLFLMMLPKRYNEDITWHESLHAVHQMMETAGQDVNDSISSSETQAYLQGSIVKKIRMEVYNKKK